MPLTLLLGGARSGKSSLAEELGRRHEAGGGSVSYIATAPIVDDDMAARVARHRADRPSSWTTIEEGSDLLGAFRRVDDRDAVIVDCLTLWVSNLMWREHDDDSIRALATAAARAAADRTGPTIVVTNEVGMGVHPETDLGRHYRDVLGRVNQIWAAEADRALLLVAGRVLPLTTVDDVL